MSESLSSFSEKNPAISRKSLPAIANFVSQLDITAELIDFIIIINSVCCGISSSLVSQPQPAPEPGRKIMHQMCFHPKKRVLLPLICPKWFIVVTEKIHTGDEFQVGRQYGRCHQQDNSPMIVSIAPGLKLPEQS